MIIKDFICEGPGGADFARDIDRNGILGHLIRAGIRCEAFDGYIIAKAPILDGAGYMRVDFGGEEGRITKIAYQVLCDKESQSRIFEKLYADMGEVLGSPAVVETSDGDSGCIPVVVWGNNNIRAELSSIEIYGLYLAVEITRAS